MTGTRWPGLDSATTGSMPSSKACEAARASPGASTSAAPAPNQPATPTPNRCGDACSVMLGRRFLDWDLPDPADTDLPTVRAVRDPVEDLVAALLADHVQKENP